MRTFVALSVIATAAVLAPASASAHFTLDQLDDSKPVSWMSQDSTGGPQKAGPCAATVANGDTMGTPTHIVTGLMAGETVKITVTATIPHPGWYRVALMEGASASQSLTTIPDPMAMSGTNCTPAIMTNPVWSKTQPVIADGLPAGSMAKTQQMGTKVLTATIPKDANCTAAAPCTIQVIMVMTDHPATDCYYHHCADITTDGSSGGDAGMMTGGDASTDAHDGGMSMGGGSAMGGAAAGGAKGSGGVMGGGGAAASGGASGSGGGTASGGTSATASGGATGTGGTSSSSGGAVASSGGKTGSGGSSSGSGGSSSSSGGTTVAGSGGSSSSGGSGSNGGGGCSAIPGGDGAPLMAAGASLLAMLVARVRRGRRKQ